MLRCLTAALAQPHQKGPGPLALHGSCWLERKMGARGGRQGGCRGGEVAGAPLVLLDSHSLCVTSIACWVSGRHFKSQAPICDIDTDRGSVGAWMWRSSMCLGTMQGCSYMLAAMHAHAT